MIRTMMNSKIHRARVTESNLNYVGSITIDADGGSGTFYLKAYYYTWDTDEVDAGAGNATARFTIMQE